MDNFSPRSRFTLRAAAAITGDDPWAMGYTEYYGTARTLLAEMRDIKRDHGGNVVLALYHKGKQVDDTSDVEFALRLILPL